MFSSIKSTHTYPNYGRGCCRTFGASNSPPWSGLLPNHDHRQAGAPSRRERVAEGGVRAGPRKIESIRALTRASRTLSRRERALTSQLFPLGNSPDQDGELLAPTVPCLDYRKRQSSHSAEA